MVASPADVWCGVPNNDSGSGGGGGVCMANAAPAVDHTGDIYIATSSLGNFVQMCQRSTGKRCTPGNGNNCQ
jgi:hypothetical protein